MYVFVIMYVQSVVVLLVFLMYLSLILKCRYDIPCVREYVIHALIDKMHKLHTYIIKTLAKSLQQIHIWQNIVWQIYVFDFCKQTILEHYVNKLC